MATDAVAHPHCPRCGYDVSGPVPDWREECPLRGLCPECGQGFAWGEVFYPDRNDLRGFFEHARARSARGLLGSAWRTWWWAMGPWGFYRRVLITHRIVWWRLALWLVFLIAPLHALAATLATVRIMAFPAAGMGARGMGAEWTTYLSCWTYPIATVDYMMRVRVVGPPGGAGGVWVAGGAAPAMTWGVNWVVEGTPVYVIAAFAAHAMFALMCLALPWTLGAAKVRRGHIARAFVYGLAWLPLLAAFRVGRNMYLLLELAESANIGMTGMGVLGWSGPVPVRLAAFFPEVLGPALLVWVAAWWAAVFVRGWKLQGAWGGWGVWMLLGTAAAIVGAATWGFVEAWLYWW